jgi:large subunit ribosomal protein L10
MAKTREQKEKIVESLTDKLSKAKMAVFTDYRGLKMDEMDDLRNQSFEKGLDYKVTKISLLALAAKNAKLDIDTSSFQDKPLAIEFGYEDEIEAAKTVYNFSKTHDKLEILGGILDGQLLDVEEITKYALLPGREELYAKLVGSVASPISGMVNVLAGNLRGLVQVLNGYKEQVS